MLDPKSAEIRLATVVQEIRWRRDSVTVMAIAGGQAAELHSRAVIVTLPLGQREVMEAVEES
jgi:hypothetical protein